MFTFPVGFFTGTLSSTPRPSWTNVRLLVDFEGVNNGVLFYDRSSYTRVITVSGETKTVTSRYPTGATSSGYFRGNNPYQFGGTRDLLTIGDPGSLIVGNSDWTIEGYAYIEGSKTDSYSPHSHLLYGRTGPEGNWFFSEWLYVDSLNGKLLFSTNFSQGSSSFGGIETPAGSVPIGSFFHYAFVKAGTLWRIFINGEVKASGGNQHLNAVNYPVTIGAQNNGSAYSYDLKGNLSWTRVCDVALYTQDFIPPTIPFPIG